MSKNELQTLFDNTPAKSYKDKITQIEEYLASIADGVNIVVAKPEDKTQLVYPDFWEYKHSFGDGIYIREMRMKKGQLGFSAIHKHSYGFFLLSGVLDCVIVTTHANPTNTEDLKEIENANVVFSWKEYEEYLQNK